MSLNLVGARRCQTRLGGGCDTDSRSRDTGLQRFKASSLQVDAENRKLLVERLLFRSRKVG